MACKEIATYRAIALFDIVPQRVIHFLVHLVKFLDHPAKLGMYNRLATEFTPGAPGRGFTCK